MKYISFIKKKRPSFCCGVPTYVCLQKCISHFDGNSLIPFSIFLSFSLSLRHTFHLGSFSLSQSRLHLNNLISIYRYTLPTVGSTNWLLPTYLSLGGLPIKHLSLVGTPIGRCTRYTYQLVLPANLPLVGR